MFELASNPIGYFGKMNSTLGSVVPLAMFYFSFYIPFSQSHQVLFYEATDDWSITMGLEGKESNQQV